MAATPTPNNIIRGNKEPANFVTEWVYDFRLETLESSLKVARRVETHVNIEKIIFCTKT